MSPRKGNAHEALNAFGPTETLQEKADRIRAEQGLPPEAEETGPRPCQWYDDGHGGRFLVPGCMERVINPDAEPCSCKTIEEQLADARTEIARLTQHRDSLQTWHDHVARAVYDHPDGVKIMKRAADRAGIGR